MKKVLLTEAQVRLITEEIDKNDSIQKLIFADTADIDFIESGDSKLIPVIEGKQISEKFVKLSVEAIKYNGGIFYQLHIEVAPEIRRLGIAEKLYTAFISQGYPACSIHGNKAIDNLWNKIAQHPDIEVLPMMDGDKQIGVIGLKK